MAVNPVSLVRAGSKKKNTKSFGAPTVLDSLPDHSRVAFYRLRLLGSARSRS